MKWGVAPALGSPIIVRSPRRLAAPSRGADSASAKYKPIVSSRKTRATKKSQWQDCLWFFFVEVVCYRVMFYVTDNAITEVKGPASQILAP